MLDKINIGRLLRDHFRTYRDYSTGKTSPKDVALFYFSPLIAAGLLCYLGKFLNKDMVEALVAAYAILVGMLLNLLVLILTVIKREGTQSPNPDVQVQAKRKLELLEETFANISYCTLVGLPHDCSSGVMSCSYALVANLGVLHRIFYFSGSDLNASYGAEARSSPSFERTPGAVIESCRMWLHLDDPLRPA